MFRIGFFTLIVFFASSLYSFTPGKWSHTDRYVIGSEKGGPSQEVVKNSNGKVIYTAKYSYDESGKLVREDYISQDGKSDGYTKFSYKDKKVQKEELFDKDGKNLETKTFMYDKNGILSSLDLFDQSGKLVLKCTILSWGENGLIKDAQTDWSDSKEIERFSIVKDSNKPGLYQQNIYNEDKQQVASTVLTFDKDGKLISRMNVQGNLERLNRMIWDNNNRLQQFTFLIKQGDKWALEKTHELVYGK
ncbi:hypothetical protein LEP1GSC058_3410 [Leptospira fainei serovar Hurstbridge str. BUT 6]|uniref:MORN repeat protein n=1 Tax=Leptospira fainei serovar Hurstbridge str. BUT 6 TaxID=1193011 RepID=S3VB44_9LEPT|nr:hypothetical protein [Leptospira fainei]EPG73685.1 hypothetical protein LEP1GSC058_3410 [Leptospira fainei serovar Hurstbridge str. BUT 6]